MIKRTITFISLILFFIFSYEFIGSYYQDIPNREEQCSQQIESILLYKDIQFRQVLDWFSKQTHKVNKEIVKEDKDKIILLYTFQNKQYKNVGSIYISFNKQKLEYEYILLKMCINGTPKTYYNRDAVKMLLSFLSYNTDFNYYF